MKPYRHLRQPSLYYEPRFLSQGERKALLGYLQTIRPIWEYRYSTLRPLPEGESQRRLLRPVYWLGNWQFACLHYYRPPKGVSHRCVRAEPYPPFLKAIVSRIERRVRESFPRADIPEGWRLNTCLINYYGKEIQGEKKIDSARVGEHRDFEPGPVASISVGERALFQFVSSRSKHERELVYQMWLDDSALQIFGGKKWKDYLFHRVQRVDRKITKPLSLSVEGFETRRVNFTFRYVPEKDWVAFRDLPVSSREDILPYIKKLAEGSRFFSELLNSH